MGISTGPEPEPTPEPALHVDAAAWAAVLAIEKARRGIYNIAEPSGYLSTEKARRELGFDANVRLNAAALTARSSMAYTIKRLVQRKLSGQSIAALPAFSDIDIFGAELFNAAFVAPLPCTYCCR
jgi:uncharacterized protein (DUF1800 family)